jgi:hypothetical protein
LTAALLVAASAGLSGCVYDVGLGFASDGYYDDAYACDPYCGYDAYYNCDYSPAFSTSALAAVGTTIMIIRATASFCSTPSDVGTRCASNIAAIGASSGIIGFVGIVGVIWAMTAMKVAIGVIRTTLGTKGQDRRTVKEAGCTTMATTGAMVGVTAGKMAMTNGLAAMVAGQLLFRYQMQVRRKAEVEGRIMVAPMDSPPGLAAEHKLGMPFPRFQGKFRRCGRMLLRLNKRVNPAPSRKVLIRRAGACLKAVKSVQSKGSRAYCHGIEWCVVDAWAAISDG